jgi:hypothetical protein
MMMWNGINLISNFPAISGDMLLAVSVVTATFLMVGSFGDILHYDVLYGVKVSSQELAYGLVGHLFSYYWTNMGLYVKQGRKQHAIHCSL